jgi:ABC-type branched-subunit amino acid transport system permease subunit
VTPRSQRAYLSLASIFLAIGAAGVVLGVLDAVLGLGLFRGNPAPTALFLLAIGAALRFTAVRGEVVPEEAPKAAPEVAPDVGDEEEPARG